MTTWTPFNINDTVRVRLTDHGRSVHKAAHAHLTAHITAHARDEWPYYPPKENDDGWSEWQLWSLMNIFGPHMWMTGEMCFATEIQFETK